MRTRQIFVLLLLFTSPLLFFFLSSFSSLSYSIASFFAVVVIIRRFVKSLSAVHFIFSAVFLKRFGECSGNCGEHAHRGSLSVAQRSRSL